MRFFLRNCSPSSILIKEICIWKKLDALVKTHFLMHYLTSNFIANQSTFFWDCTDNYSLSKPQNYDLLQIPHLITFCIKNSDLWTSVKNQNILPKLEYIKRHSTFQLFNIFDQFNFSIFSPTKLLNAFFDLKKKTKNQFCLVKIALHWVSCLRKIHFLIKWGKFLKWNDSLHFQIVRVVKTAFTKHMKRKSNKNHICLMR